MVGTALVLSPGPGVSANPARAIPLGAPTCPGYGVDQQPDGQFTTCLRLGALPPGPATVSLELDRLDEGGRGPGLGPRADLTLSPAAGPPGTPVVIHGTTPDHRSTTTQDGDAMLCWDGCGPQGYIEQGVSFRWTSPHTFVATLIVPQAPWLGARGIQPLVSGSYPVGVECLLVIRGCALGGPEGTASFRLHAPAHGRCTAGEPCATARLDPLAARPASQVRVSGWAPLDSFIGSPFGLEVTVRSGRPPRRPAPTPTIIGGGVSVFRLAPTPLRVLPAPSWSQLGAVRGGSLLPAGLAAIAAQPGAPTRLAWCAPGVIRVRGGGPRRIPVAGALEALRRAGLAPQALGAAPETSWCQAVALEARDRATVYAAFAVGAAPPVQMAAVVTTDSGLRWHLVPVPSTMAATDFGGFRQSGGATTLVFSSPAGERPGAHPLPVETTTDGGRRWTQEWLGCPPAGPCVTLGAYAWGNCAMTGEAQAVLRGTPAAAGRPTTWSPAGWVGTVNPCLPAQLVATRRQGALLIGGGSPYFVLRSGAGGRSWADVGIPPPPGPDQGLGLPGGGGLILLPDGALLDTVVGAPGVAAGWALLAAGGHRWCRLPARFTTGPDPSADLQLVGTQLAWLDQLPLGREERVVLHTVALDQLRC